jgi:hypothetical protein
MNKYKATVRVRGKPVRTAVFADSALHARLILEFQYGIGSIVNAPSSATNEDLDAATPPTPQQARIDALKKQKDAITKNLQAERDRQKLANAQHAIASVNTSLPKI